MGRKRTVLISFFLGVIVLASACSSPGGRLRSNAFDSKKIQFKNTDNLRVTGVGCASNEVEARRYSRRDAQFNLRTLTGNKRLVIKFREIGSYESDGQICVESEAQSSPR